MKTKTFEEEANRLIELLLIKGYYGRYALEPNGIFVVDAKEMSEKIKYYRYSGKRIPRIVKRFFGIRYAFSYGGIHFLLF